jgi:isopentenyl diphosphate isomerase/L-lactate dehydrogenase-like FMN-dependent dehydrogenase
MINDRHNILDLRDDAMRAPPQIVRAVGDRVEEILDGGIRRAADVLKVLSRGAKAYSVGKTYLYGLATGGEAGVARALEIRRKEPAICTHLVGCASVAYIDGDLIKRPP